MVFILFAYVGLILLRQICCICSYYVTQALKLGLKLERSIFAAEF